MKLGEIQGHVIQRLKDAAALVSVPVLAYDGSNEFFKTSVDRQTALSVQGICLTVWQPEAGELIDDGSGVGSFEADIAVIIEENAPVNREANGGLRISAEAAVQHVFEAVVGTIPAEAAFGRDVRIANPPFENFGNFGGVQRYAAFFTVQIHIETTNP